MEKLWDYLCWACAVLWACLTGIPIIDPEDPLEHQGGVRYRREKRSIPWQAEHLDAELFYPEYPTAFVLFLPGFGASYDGYLDIIEHMASHGYLVVGLNFFGSSCTIDSNQDDKADQALTAIDYVKELSHRFRDLAVFTAGHSLGGKISFYSASLRTSISGVMGLDPVNAGGPPCAIFPNACIAYPVAPNSRTGQRGLMYQMGNTSSIIFRSAPDPFTNPDAQFNAENFYFGSNGAGQDAAPSPSWYFNMGNFPHAGYLSWLPSEQIQIFKRTMVAFLNQETQGFDGSDYLTGDRIQNDINSGRLLGKQNR